MTCFDAQRALDFAIRISRPRLCGSEEEHRVAHEICSAFREAGLQVDDEPFYVRHLGDAWVRASLAATHGALAAAAVGLFVNPQLTWAGLGAFVLIVGLSPLGARLLARVSVRDAARGAPLPPGWLQSANLVGRTAPAGDGQRGGPLFVFVAHYDSKSQSLSLGERFHEARKTRSHGFSFMGLLLAGLVGIDLPPLLVAGAWLVLVGLAAPLYLLRTHNRSPGANDNASGVGVIVELARVWPTLPAASRARAIFLATSAEELGLLGSDLWVRKHLAELRAEAQLFVLNFDTVGAPGQMWVLPSRGLRRRNTPMSAAMVAAGEAAAVEVRPYPPRVALTTDHLSFTRLGLPCATLLSHEWSDEVLHTVNDTAASLDMEAFTRVGKVALACIEGAFIRERLSARCLAEPDEQA